MIQQITNIALLLTILILPLSGFGATEVIQTGIASPQNEEEKNNIEKLRQRAIRNAMDLAVMKVTGITVSSDRGNSIRTREDIIIHGEDVEERSSQQSRFRVGATSRTEGHARLVEIIREWQENG